VAGAPENSKDRGDETEAKIIYTLISSGYSVSVPFGDNDKYDLIVDDSEALYRIQCKTAWTTKKGTMRFNTHSQTTKNGEYHERTYHGDVDAFAIRYPENGKISGSISRQRRVRRWSSGSNRRSITHQSTGPASMNSPAISSSHIIGP
jgi:hypothetical protein